MTEPRPSQHRAHRRLRRPGPGTCPRAARQRRGGGAGRPAPRPLEALAALGAAAQRDLHARCQRRAAMQATWPPTGGARIGTPDAGDRQRRRGRRLLTTARPSDLAVMRRMLEINLLGVATTFQPFVAPMRAAAARHPGRRGQPRRLARPAGQRRLLRQQGRPDRLPAKPARRAARQRRCSVLAPSAPATCAPRSPPATASRCPACWSPTRPRAHRSTAWHAAASTSCCRAASAGWRARSALLPAALARPPAAGGQPRKPRAGEAGATPDPGPHALAPPNAEHQPRPESKTRP